MKKEALLIIDMLNDFVSPGAPLAVPDTHRVIASIRREIDRARTAGKPIIYLCDNHAPDDKEFRKFGWPAHAVQGTKGAEVVAELEPAPSDIVVLKDTYSGFYGTRLDEELKSWRWILSGLRVVLHISASCLRQPMLVFGTIPLP